MLSPYTEQWCKTTNKSNTLERAWFENLELEARIFYHFRLKARFCASTKNKTMHDDMTYKHQLIPSNQKIKLKLENQETGAKQGL